MKIAFILPSLANTGPILVIQELVAALVRQGHECDVYYFDNILQLEMACPTYKISFFKKINFNAYDVVHTNMFRPDVYCALNRSGIRKNTKLMVTVHTDINRDLKAGYGLLKSMIGPPIWRWAWRKMDKIVVLSNFAKNTLAADGLTNKIAVINNGRDIKPGFPDIPEADRELIEDLKSKYTLLGAVAAFDKRKGFEQVVELLKLKPDYAFMIVGDGSERENLERMAVQNKLTDRFKVLGARPQGFRYSGEFDLYMMPSRSEGLPLALLEAVALKTAVVCSAIPVFHEFFSDNEVTFFTLDDIASLKTACETALKNRETLRENAYKRYKRDYTVQVMANNYIKEYTD